MISGIIGERLEDHRRELEELANGPRRRQGEGVVRHRGSQEPRQRGWRKGQAVGGHQQPERRRHQHLHHQPHHLQ